MSKAKNNTIDKFNFFVPANFEKSGEEGEMKISGICSSIVEDSDGESLDPSGFDFAPLLNSGYYNWNHQANKEPGAILGRPTMAKVINKGKDFYTEGFLYKGLQKSKDLFDLAETLEKEDPERRLGFSIEGQAIQRDAINPKRILKARITGIAITHCPKNPNTLLSIIKGEYQEPFVEVESLESELGVVDNEIEKGKDYKALLKKVIARRTGKSEDEVTDDEMEKAGQSLDKSMGVAETPMPESVEGKPKGQVDKDKIIEKSDIYLEIFSKYTQDVQKSEEVYSFIQQVSQKLFNMKDNKVTAESLQKAFDLLDQTIVKSETGGEPEKKKEDYNKKDELMKDKTQEGGAEGETTTTTTAKPEETTDNDDDDDSVEKGIDCYNMAKPMIEKGERTHQEIIGDLIEKGFKSELSTAVVNKIVGGTATPVVEKVATLVQDDGIQKSFEATNDLIKSLQNNFDAKTSAIGTVLKEIVGENKTLKETVEKLEKSQQEQQQELQKLKTEPFPKKSITDLRVVERFEKSQDGVSDGNTFSLSKAEDRKALTQTLFAKVQDLRNSGRTDATIEKAIMDLEISKSLSSDAIPSLNLLGIKITQ